MFITHQIFFICFGQSSDYFEVLPSGIDPDKHLDSPVIALKTSVWRPDPVGVNLYHLDLDVASSSNPSAPPYGDELRLSGDEETKSED
jgi:hypothetical protein